MRSNIKTLIHLAERQGTVSGVIQAPKIYFPSTKKSLFLLRTVEGVIVRKVNPLWVIIAW